MAIWQVSPPAVPDEGGNIHGGITVSDPITDSINDTFITFGGVLKGVSWSSIHWLFEIDEPVGTVFTASKLECAFFATSGVGVPLTFMLGLCVTDGVWEAGGESSKGMGGYANTGDTVRPGSLFAPDWVGSGVAALGTIAASPAQWSTPGEKASFGSILSGSDFESLIFTDKIQQAFDENEVHRTSRGVPILFFMTPTSSDLKEWSFYSQNGPPSARPTLELIGAPADQGTIYTVIAKPSQVTVAAKVAQATVVAKVDAIDVTAKPSQATATAKAAQIDVTAKPDTVDVPRG